MSVWTLTLRQEIFVCFTLLRSKFSVRCLVSSLFIHKWLSQMIRQSALKQSRLENLLCSVRV